VSQPKTMESKNTKTIDLKDFSWRTLGDEIFGSWKDIKDSVSYGRKLRKDLERKTCLLNKTL